MDENTNTAPATDAGTDTGANTAGTDMGGQATPATEGEATAQ